MIFKIINFIIIQSFGQVAVNAVCFFSAVFVYLTGIFKGEQFYKQDFI